MISLHDMGQSLLHRISTVYGRQGRLPYQTHDSIRLCPKDTGPQATQRRNLFRRYTVHHTYLLGLATCLASALILSGCGGGGGTVLPTTAAGTYRSAPLTMGNGTARTYVVIGANGNPTSVGVVVDETALQNLPPAVKTLFELPLPPEASTTAFNHIELRYWSHGHDPNNLFMHTHFDFIPFMISSAERNAITAVGADLDRVLKTPAIDAIPIGFAPIPNVDEFYAEPRYGTRFFDVASFTPVLNGQAPYTTTLFYGYYNGLVDFLEIPITFDYLANKTNTVFPIPLPKTLPKPGFYPTSYRISFNAETHEYTFALEGLVQR